MRDFASLGHLGGRTAARETRLFHHDQFRFANHPQLLRACLGAPARMNATTFQQIIYSNWLVGQPNSEVAPAASCCQLPEAVNDLYNFIKRLYIRMPFYD